MARKSKRKNLLSLVEELSTEDYEEALSFGEACLDPRMLVFKTALNHLWQLDDTWCMNVHELIFMYKNVKKLENIFHLLRSNVEYELGKRRKMCPVHKIDFRYGLIFNIWLHSISCDLMKFNKSYSEEMECKYDNMVELRLYSPHILERVRAIEGCNTFSVRLKKNNTIECLVCNFRVSQTDISKLWDHICSKSHMRQLELHRCNLLKYHEYWMTQKSSDQDVQVIYQYIDDKVMKCIKCKEAIPYDDVLPHLKNCVPKRVRGRKLNENKVPLSQSLDYSEEVRNALYQAVPSLDMDDIEYYTMQSISGTIFCMMCNAEVIENVEVHCDSDSHSINQSYFTCTQSLKEYHNVWSSLPSEKQMQQIHFRRDPFGMTCNVCNCCIDYDAAIVEEHMELTEHVNNLTSPKERRFKKNARLKKKLMQEDCETDKKIENDEQGWKFLTSDMMNDLLNIFKNLWKSEEPLPSITKTANNPGTTGGTLSTNGPSHVNKIEKKESDNTIKEALRTLPYTEDTMKELFDDVPNIWLSGALYPILQKNKDAVHCLLCAETIKEPLSEHLNSNTHLQRAADSRHMKSLQQYHDIWSSLPGDIQTQQIYYKRLMKAVGCLICSVDVPCSKINIQEHLISKMHKNRFATRFGGQTNGGIGDPVSNPITTGTSNTTNSNHAKKIVKKGSDNASKEDKSASKQFLASNPITTGTSNTTNSNHAKKIVKKGSDNASKEDKSASKQLSSPNSVTSADAELPKRLIEEDHKTDKKIENNEQGTRSQSSDDQLLINLFEGIRLRQLEELLKLKTCNPETTGNTLNTNNSNHINKIGKKESDNTTKEVFRTLTYAESTIKELFDDVPNLWISGALYPMLQKNKDTVHCLLCTETITEQLNDHLNSSGHLQRTTDPQHTKSLQQYHDIWSSLPSDVQTQQIHCERLMKAVSCLLCSVQLPCTKINIQEHLISKKHKSRFAARFGGQTNGEIGDLANPTTGTFNSNSSSNVNKIEKKGSANTIKEDTSATKQLSAPNSARPGGLRTLAYTADTIKELFDDVPNLILEGTPYPVIQKRESAFYCLFCTKIIKESFTEHLNSNTHLQRATNPVHMESLRQYHDVWSSLPGDVQTQQIHYKRLIKDVTCLLCAAHLPCTKINIQQHSTSKKHGKQLAAKLERQTYERLANNPTTSTSTTTNLSHVSKIEGTETGSTLKEDKSATKELNSLNSVTSVALRTLPYTEDTIKELFDDVPNVWLGGTLHPIIQKNKDALHCLICTETIKESLTEHLNLNRHLQKAIDPQHMKSLQWYHDIWSSLPGNVQTEQIYYKRFKKEMTCVICSVDLPYVRINIQQHSASKKHKKKLAAKLEQQTNEEMGKLELIPHLEEVPNLDTLIYFMDKRMHKLSDDTHCCFEDSEAHTSHVDLENMLQYLYSDFPRAIIDGKSYPIMQRLKECVHCLLCNDDISIAPSKHIYLNSHINKEKRHLSSLKKYHNIIIALPPKFQRQQMYFGRYKRMFTCSICDTGLPYDTFIVRDHMESQLHQENFSKNELTKKDASYFNCHTTSSTTFLIFDNVIGYHMRSVADLDTMIYLMDVNIKKDTLESDESSTNNSHSQRKSVSTFVEDLAADSFVLLPISYWEDLFGISKTRQYDFLCDTPIKESDCQNFLPEELEEVDVEEVEEDSDNVKIQIATSEDISSGFNVESNTPIFTPSNKNSCFSKNYCEHVSDDFDGVEETREQTYITDEYQASLTSTSKAGSLSGDDYGISPTSGNTNSIGTADSYTEDLYSENETYNSDTCLEDCAFVEDLEQENEKTLCDLKDENPEGGMNQNMSYTNKISFPLQPNTVHRLKVPTIFPSYHASISDVLYGNGLIHYSLKLDDVKYPMIQNIGPYKHCLICAQSLSSELFHCNSESHINNTKNRQTQLLLRKYHNVFVHLPIEYQIQQKYFRKEEQLRCILCCVSIPYDSKLILGHVQLPQHNSKQERFEAEPSTSRDSSPNIKQKIETPIKKSSPTKSRSEGGSKTNSPKNAETEINFENGISDLTDPTTTNNKSRNNKQQQSASSIQSPKKSSPKKTPHHQTTLEYSSAAKDKLFKDLEEYIATIDGNNYFIFRHSMLDIRCILCNDGPVNNLSDHIKTGNHIKRMETESALRVLEKFHNMWMIDSKLQEHQFYIIQKHCHKCHVTSHGKNIISHVLSKEHIKNVDDETKEENSEIPNETHVSYDANKSDAAALESENNVSDGGSKRDHVVLENDQIHGESLETTEISLNYALWVKDSLYNGLSQYTVTVDSIKYPYLRRTCRGLRCILCKDAAVHNITDHINKEVHVKLMGTSVACKEVQSFHNIWLRFCPHDQSQQIYFINGRCILCCLKNGLYDDIDEHLAYKGHRITEGYETVEELHEQMGIGDKFQYCEEAQAAFYEGLNDYYAFYGIIKLPLLRVTTEGTRCILCDDAGVASPKQHVGTPGHKQAEYDTQRLEKLWKFHKMWQRMTPRAQMHQQYVILTMCIACDKKLSVDTAEAHVLSKMHKGNVKLKQQKTAKPTNTKKHDVKESAIDPKSQHMLSQLPSYLSYHLKALTSDVKNHDKVKCTFCNKVFTRLFELRKHLDSVAHCKELKVHQFEGNFFCEICVLSYPNDALWLEHLSNAKHVDRVSKLGDSRKANMKEHTCNTCRMIIFGDAISLLRHGRDKTDNETKLSLTKGLKELLSSRKHITDVADELLKLSESEMEESEANVEKCCLALEKALWSEYPNCHAYPFGSRVTGLGNNNSDLDVFIDIGGVYGGSEFQSATEQADIVSSVGTLLEKQRKHFCHINKICGARTPIVQVLHSDTEIDCDISFRHGLSVENTELIKYCLELQPIAKPTMLVLKDWLVKSELPYGSITSYAFTLLFIFFMQRENYLLPIADIRKINKSKGPFIDGWEAIKYSKTPMEMKSYIITCQLSIPELLEMFFTYYSNFDFNSLVICPLIGRTLSKFHFHPRKPNLPVEMATYIQKLNSSANPEQFRNRTPMGVQDPFDLSHNVTKGCSDICTKMFKKFCRLSKSQISALK